MYFKAITLICIAVFCSISSAQMLQRSTIGSMGNSCLANGIILSQSLGQSSNTATFTNQQTLRQGFQQALIGQMIFDFETERVLLTLQPNPVSTTTILGINITSYKKALWSTTSIEIDSIFSVNYLVQISNVTGHIFKSFHINSLHTEINFSSLPEGIYLLCLWKNKQIIGSIKLVKKR